MRAETSFVFEVDWVCLIQRPTSHQYNDYIPATKAQKVMVPNVLGQLQAYNLMCIEHYDSPV